MPKMKTHKAAAKRFRTTGTGKIMRGKAFKSHMLEKKTTKRKRNFRKEAVLEPSDRKMISRKLGIG